MSGEKGLDRRRPGRARTAGMAGAKEFKELFRGSHRESIGRVPDDVRVDVFGEMKPDRDSAGTGHVRVVVRHSRRATRVREANRHWRGLPLHVRRTCKRAGAGCWMEDARKHDAFGVRRPKAWMRPAEIVERLNQIPAQ